MLMLAFFNTFQNIVEKYLYDFGLSVTLQRYTVTWSLYNMLCVAHTVRVQGNSKGFCYIMVYEQKSFAAYINDGTLLQT